MKGGRLPCGQRLCKIPTLVRYWLATNGVANVGNAHQRATSAASRLLELRGRRVVQLVEHPPPGEPAGDESLERLWRRQDQRAAPGVIPDRPAGDSDGLAVAVNVRADRRAAIPDGSEGQALGHLERADDLASLRPHGSPRRSYPARFRR